MVAPVIPALLLLTAGLVLAAPDLPTGLRSGHELVPALQSLLTGAVGGVTAFLAVGVPVMTGVACVAGMLAPVLVRRQRSARARASAVEAWPDAIDLIRGAVRAGMTVADAVTEPAARGPQPLRARFVEYRRRSAGGEPFDRAVGALCAAFDPVADRVVSVLLLAASVGSADVGRVLAEMASFLRADLAQRREIDARHSWNVAAARLAVLAPWLIVAALSLQPESRAAYGSAPGTLLLAGVALVTIGAYWLMTRASRTAAAEASL